MAGACIGLCYIGGRNKNFNYVIFGLAAYSVIMGMRYGVGIDYPAYLEMFNAAEKGYEIIDLERTEPGFKFLTKSIANITQTPFIYFSSLAFIQIFPFFYIVKKNPQIWVFIAFSFIFSCLWLSFANTIRQFVATGFLFYGLQYIANRDFKKYCFCILVGATFHHAVIIFLLLYPIFLIKNNWIPNKFITIFLLFFSIGILKSNIISQYLSTIEIIATYFNYDSYFSGSNSKYMEANVQLGIGFFLMFLMNLIIVWNSDRIIKYYKKKTLLIIYNVYVVGTCLMYITLFNQMISRLMLYMSTSSFFLYALVLYFFYKRNKKTYYLYLLPPIILFFGTIFKVNPAINGGAYYRFLFDYI